jgi:hypothetical protein
MEDILIIAIKDTQTRLLAPRKESLALLLQRRLVLVVVLDRSNTVIQRDMEVVVEVRAEGRNPGESPSHALLERFDLVERRAGHGYEGGLSGAQVREIREVVGGEGAAGACFCLAGAQHEVVDEQLLPTVKQVEERDFPRWPFKGVLLVKVDHGEVAQLGAQGFAGAEGFFLLDEEIFALGKPLFSANDLWKERMMLALNTFGEELG